MSDIVPMTESELIARWLGWKVCPGAKWHWYFQGHIADVPDFRTSNEWAGAVLEKLLRNGLVISGSETVVHHFMPETMWGGALDWRSAVVDAALEVIRREKS